MSSFKFFSKIEMQVLKGDSIDLNKRGKNYSSCINLAKFLLLKSSYFSKLHEMDRFTQNDYLKVIFLFYSNFLRGIKIGTNFSRWKNISFLLPVIVSELSTLGIPLQFLEFSSFLIKFKDFSKIFTNFPINIEKYDTVFSRTWKNEII